MDTQYEYVIFLFFANLLLLPIFLLLLIHTACFYFLLCKSRFLLIYPKHTTDIDRYRFLLYNRARKHAAAPAAEYGGIPWH